VNLAGQPVDPEVACTVNCASCGRTTRIYGTGNSLRTAVWVTDDQYGLVAWALERHSPEGDGDTIVRGTD
jgi:hypothetical protein